MIRFLPGFLVFLLLSLICEFIGFYLMLKPEASIELQRRFYAKINWKLEPISMTKEVRNTRIIGFLTSLFVAILIYVLGCKWFC